MELSLSGRSLVFAQGGTQAGELALVENPARSAPSSVVVAASRRSSSPRHTCSSLSVDSAFAFLFGGRRVLAGLDSPRSSRRLGLTLELVALEGHQPKLVARLIEFALQRALALLQLGARRRAVRRLGVADRELALERRDRSGAPGGYGSGLGPHRSCSAMRPQAGHLGKGEDQFRAALRASIAPRRRRS